VARLCALNIGFQKAITVSNIHYLPTIKKLLWRLSLTGSKSAIKSLRLLEKIPAPDGLEWRFKPLKDGGVTAFLARKADIKTYDTSLERRVEEILNELGYVEGKDYEK